MELIASEVDSSKLTFELEHDSEILAHDTGINYKVVEEMMTYMIDLGLFESAGGVITCFALAKRADEYLVKSLKRDGKLEALDKLRTNSGQTPDNIRPEEIREDETKELKDTSVSQAKTDPYDWEFVLQQWNEFADRNDLSQMRVVGDKRARTIKQSFATANKLLKKSGSETMGFNQFVERYLAKAETAITPFHKGQERGSNWKADFNYVFAKDVTESLLTQGELKR